MKIKKGFVLKDICGESIIVAEGKENIDFTKIISMNESSAFLWESVKDKEFDAETLKHLALRGIRRRRRYGGKRRKGIARQLDRSRNS